VPGTSVDGGANWNCAAPRSAAAPRVQRRGRRQRGRWQRRGHRLRGRQWRADGGGGSGSSASGDGDSK